MLHSIAADDNLEAFVIVTFRRDGTAAPHHINCSRKDMAFASVILAHNCLQGEDD